MYFIHWLLYSPLWWSQALLEAQGDIRRELEAKDQEVQRLQSQVLGLEEQREHLTGARRGHGVTPSVSAETQASSSYDAAEAKVCEVGESRE